jgi:hypothetical protein
MAVRRSVLFLSVGSLAACFRAMAKQFCEFDFAPGNPSEANPMQTIPDPSAPNL